MGVSFRLHRGDIAEDLLLWFLHVYKVSKRTVKTNPRLKLFKHEFYDKGKLKIAIFL